MLVLVKTTWGPLSQSRGAVGDCVPNSTLKVADVGTGKGRVPSNTWGVRTPGSYSQTLQAPNT